MPDGSVYLWRTFHRLSSRRGSSGFGPARITWLDLDAFQRVGSMRLAPWEVEIIEALDDAWTAEVGHASSRGQG